MNVIKATKFTNKNGPYYIGILAFEEPIEVNSVSIVKSEKDFYFAFAPKLQTKDGEWRSVIKWSPNKAHKLAFEAVEAGNVYMFENPVQNNLGMKVGTAKISIPCEVEVAVFIDKKGVPYLRLPGRQYSITDENGNEVKKTSYFIQLPEDVRNNLAKELIALAEKEQ